MGQITTLDSPINESLKLEINANSQVLNASAVTYSQKGKKICNKFESDEQGFNNKGGLTGPYFSGILGNWRPYENWTFLSDRTPREMLDHNSLKAIRNTGLTTNFSPFWSFNSNSTEWTSNSAPWTLSNKVTMYDHRGNEVENKDALGIYSAAIFDFENSLVTAVANNAQYREILYDSFEEDLFNPNCLFTELLPRLDFKSYLSSQIAVTGTQAHTGKFAFEFKPSNQISYSIPLNEACVESPPTSPLVSCEDCLPILTPYSGKEYAIAVWTASMSSLNEGIKPSGLDLKVVYLDKDNNDKELSSQLLAPSGPVIEGWQQIEAKLDIPVDASALKLEFANNSTESVFIDDFRFHPWLSNMQSYVYDPYSMRLMAQLDENNYASFYEYNDEGLLIRTKRETERGIVTIQEGRTILKPTNALGMKNAQD